jgi:hypothetical protein
VGGPSRFDRLHSRPGRGRSLRLGGHRARSRWYTNRVLLPQVSRRWLVSRPVTSDHRRRISPSIFISEHLRTHAISLFKVLIEKAVVHDSVNLMADYGIRSVSTWADMLDCPVVQTSGNT